jgi:hypothetical protein
VAHTVIGARGWFVGGLVIDTLSTPDLRDWPADGVLVLMLYFDHEASPGKPYRQAMMGNDSYFHVPSTGVYGHNDESVSEIKSRYGDETIVMRGMWASPAEYVSTVEAAMSAEVWP